MTHLRNSEAQGFGFTYTADHEIGESLLGSGAKHLDAVLSVYKQIFEVNGKWI